MHTATPIRFASAALILAAGTALALDGDNGYAAEQLFTAADVQANATYLAGFAGERWQDLDTLVFWPTHGDGIDVNGAGDLFFIVKGRDTATGSPLYTGLVRYDGASLLTLTQVSSGPAFPWHGEQLHAVEVSPTDTGALTAGHPVVKRRVSDPLASPNRRFELVSVDPATGAEALLATLDGETNSERIAIDGSGTASDGTIYVGPLVDGSIARFTYDAATGDYTRDSVPISGTEVAGLAIDPDGFLYTSPVAQSGSAWDASPVHRVDPATGTATEYAQIAGRTTRYDWTFAPDGRFWVGLFRRLKQGYYVGEILAGETTSANTAVSNSDTPPRSLAAGADGRLYVLERPEDPLGNVWVLTPGSGGGGGNGKGKKK